MGFERLLEYLKTQKISFNKQLSEAKKKYPLVVLSLALTEIIIAEQPLHEPDSRFPLYAALTGRTEADLRARLEQVHQCEDRYGGCMESISSPNQVKRCEQLYLDCVLGGRGR